MEVGQLRIPDALLISVLSTALTLALRLLFPASAQLWMTVLVIVGTSVLFTWAMWARNVEWSRLLVDRIGRNLRVGALDA